MIDREVAQWVRRRARHNNVHREQNQDDNDRARGWFHVKADLVVCRSDFCYGGKSLQSLPRHA